MTFDLSEYENSIYHNPQRYDDQYWWKKNDIEFWRQILDQYSGNKILELGCGTGRIGLPLIKSGAKYDIIFIGFNTFLHLLKDSDAIHFLHSVKKHMHSNSLFYIDIFIPDPAFLYKKTKRIKNLEYFDSNLKKTMYIDEVCDFNQSNDIMKVTWIYYTKNKIEEEQYHFTMRMYYPDTINRIITDVGLHINNLWGDYELNAINESSELQIYECQL